MLGSSRMYVFMNGRVISALRSGEAAVPTLALVAVVVGRRKPHLVPRRRLPSPRKVAYGVGLSALYQLSICLLLLGTVALAAVSLTTGVSSLAIFIFMWNWDSFFWPLLVTTDDRYRTLPLGIALFESSYGTNYPQLMAVAFLAMLPVLLVFLVLQRNFVEALTMSGNSPPTPAQNNLIPAPVPVDSTITEEPGLAR